MTTVMKNPPQQWNHYRKPAHYDGFQCGINGEPNNAPSGLNNVERARWYDGWQQGARVRNHTP